jgi:hypothetical protein
MLQAVKEVTEWDVEYRQPNHTYLLDGDKILAYIKYHQGEPIYSKGKLTLSRTRRKFIPADINLFEVPEPESHLIPFKSSSGTTYFVDPHAKTCTCPGYKFHRKCRHLKEVA